MTLRELHALLGRLEIVLSVHGDRLHYQAPPGAMTPEVKTALATHKPALMRLLSAVESPAPPPPPWPPRPAELAGPPIPPEWCGANLDGHWREALAYWPVEWRRRWATRVEVLLTTGMARVAGEYWAFRQVVAEINEVEACGEE